MNYLFIVIIGLITGSFLNVCIYRIPKGESISFPPSHCPGCGTRLKPIDLIPVLSYLLLGRKCRYCSASISLLYPAVEVLWGIILVSLFHKFSLSSLFVKYAILTGTLLIIAIIDLKTQEIPDGLLLFGGAAALLFISADRSIPITSAVLGAAIGFGLFLTIALLTNAMGGGDIKLMALIGLAVGWKQVLLVSLFSFVIGAVVSLLLILFKIKSRKDFIPFAPFIATAYIIAVLWGNEILMIYMNSI